MPDVKYSATPGATFTPDDEPVAEPGRKRTAS
jgi:hypothetical protein